MSQYRAYFAMKGVDPSGTFRVRRDETREEKFRRLEREWRENNPEKPKTCGCDAKKVSGESNVQSSDEVAPPEWTHEDGGHYDFVFGHFTHQVRFFAGEGGVAVNTQAFSKFWRVFWVRHGHVNLTNTFEVKCRGNCKDGKNNCKPTLNRQGRSSAQSGPTSVHIAMAKTVSENCVEFEIAVGAAAFGTGGPQFGGKGKGVTVAWPDAHYQNTFEIGTFVYCCECSDD